MAIRLAEKEHWKERIEEKIKKRISAVKSENAKLFEDIQREAEAKTIESLGLTEDMKRLEKLKAKETETSAQWKELTTSVRNRLFPNNKEIGHCYSHYNEIRNAISEIRKAHEEKIYGNHEVGRELLKLQNERENILDTVWLATSPRQVTELWQRVVNLLGEDTTDFQKEILSEHQE